MNILLIEDEAMVAERLKRFVIEVFPVKADNVLIIESLSSAQNALATEKPDLVFLDLNLDSEDGFELLKTSLIGAHQTIIASANTERAIEAFEYGVLDFVPKPFSIERLALAYQRFLGVTARQKPDTKCLPVKAGNKIKLLNLKEILYFRAEGKYTGYVLFEGTSFSQEKSLNALEVLLPDNFFRCHRSIIINLAEVENLKSHRGSKYSLRCKNGVELPVGRTRINGLRKALNI